MLSLAYDGTINGDWASHYAIRLAQHRPDQTLELVHVDEGKFSPTALQERLHLLNDRCAMAGVTMHSHVLPLKGTVFDTLAAKFEPGADSLIVCGTRVREGRRGYLTGTVSEKLLRPRTWNVLALRVVRPGVLGHPRRLLLPVGGRPEGMAHGAPFLRLFAPDAREMHVLWVREVGRWRYRRLTHEKAQALLQPGRDYLRRIEAALSEMLDNPDVRIEGEAALSDDVPKEIAICASRNKSDLIFMGASRRNLRERFIYGNPIEQTLRNTPCDVAIYGGCA